MRNTEVDYRQYDLIDCKLIPVLLYHGVGTDLFRRGGGKILKSYFFEEYIKEKIHTDGTRGRSLSKTYIK